MRSDWTVWYAYSVSNNDGRTPLMDYDQVRAMIQDLRAELEDKIETLQREVDELREMVTD